MAKLKVLNPFRDKIDHKTWRKPGQEIIVTDEARAKELVDRGLCAVVKGKASNKKTENPEETQQPKGEQTPETVSEE